jgi:hypothetical protein
LLSAELWIFFEILVSFHDDAITLSGETRIAPALMVASFSSSALLIAFWCFDTFPFLHNIPTMYFLCYSFVLCSALCAHKKGLIPLIVNPVVGDGR